MTVTRSTPRAPDLTGMALHGRYELHELIGEGTFGRVYRGRDRRLARWVAVKVIKPWWSEDPQWAESFEREAQLLASVSDSGIIQIFDVGAAPEGLYYVAELVDGESLAVRLGRGPLAAEESAGIAAQLARALAAAHARGIVHRDVKPANVLITADGRVKVGDFGVARLAEGSTDSDLATVAGTPAYMAPEQARGGPTTQATDVYAVGVILHEMLSGRPPFRGRSAVELALQHVSEPPPALPRRTPAALAEIVTRALAKDPARRPRDGAELAVALERAGRLIASGPRPPTVRRSRAGAIAGTAVGEPFSPRRTANPSERRQRIAILSGVLVLALGMAIVAVVIAAAGRVIEVPALRGLDRSQINAAARHDGFRPAFDGRYSTSPPGRAIGQAPAPGTRVAAGAAVRVTLSRGPAPVELPPLLGTRNDAAARLLAKLKLHVTVAQVPAPGVAPGTVTAQRPTAGTPVASGSTVMLSVAEVPQWHTVATVTGPGGTTFRIRGGEWRIDYTMAYQGTCTFLIICQAPMVTVRHAASGTTIDSFDLSDGTGQLRTFSTGPGLFALRVTPGGDSAQWSIRVQDHF